MHAGMSLNLLMSPQYTNFEQAFGCQSKSLSRKTLLIGPQTNLTLSDVGSQGRD